MEVIYVPATLQECKSSAACGPPIQRAELINNVKMNFSISNFRAPFCKGCKATLFRSQITNIEV